MSCAGARPCSVTARTVTRQASPAHAFICLQRPLRHVSRNPAANRQRHKAQRSLSVQAGLLSMFLSTKPNLLANADLVGELLELASDTAGGAAASKDQKKSILQLVERLRSVGGVRDPCNSDLLYGEYEVTYASVPVAAGGPILRSPPGRLVFAEQQLRQILSPDDTLLNAVAFKAFGLFPGNASQDARLEKLSASSFKLILKPSKIFGIQVGPDRRIERFFNVLYLDEKVRVVKFVPDQSKGQRNTVLFVLKRLSAVPTPQSSNQKQVPQWPNALRILQERVNSLKGNQHNKADPEA